MLTADAISALLRAGESETLGFKERFGADVIETAVAFANTHGGTILMSVRDDALMVGVPARQMGWMSEFGEQIPLPLHGQGQYTCPHTGRAYVLQGDGLSVE